MLIEILGSNCCCSTVVVVAAVVNSTGVATGCCGNRCTVAAVVDRMSNRRNLASVVATAVVADVARAGTVAVVEATCYWTVGAGDIAVEVASVVNMVTQLQFLLGTTNRWGCHVAA